MALAPRLGQLGNPHGVQRHRHQTVHRLQPVGGRKDEFAWVSICFWIESASAGDGIREIASYTECRSRPTSEATAIALLALQDEKRTPAIQASLGWLKQRSANIESVESLAWCILSLVRVPRADRASQSQTGDARRGRSRIRNNATLACRIFALKCGEMIHPFEVLR